MALSSPVLTGPCPPSLMGGKAHQKDSFQLSHGCESIASTSVSKDAHLFCWGLQKFFTGSPVVVKELFSKLWMWEVMSEDPVHWESMLNPFTAHHLCRDGEGGGERVGGGFVEGMRKRKYMETRDVSCQTKIGEASLCAEWAMAMAMA